MNKGILFVIFAAFVSSSYNVVAAEQDVTAEVVVQLVQLKKIVITTVTGEEKEFEYSNKEELENKIAQLFEENEISIEEATRVREAAAEETEVVA